MALQYVDLQRKLGSGKLVPAVLGCVLFNGEDDWVERLETRSRIDLEPGSRRGGDAAEAQVPGHRRAAGGRGEAGAAGKRGGADVPAAGAKDGGRMLLVLVAQVRR